MNYTFINCLLGAGITLCLGYLLYCYRNPVGKIIINVTGHTKAIDSITEEYNWLESRIEGAATKEELAWIESMIEDFEQGHKSHAWVGEMYKDLLVALQQRHNVLTAQNRIVSKA